MDFRQRILRGVFSSLASRGLSIASQLITIPVLARGWGVETYGQYLTVLRVAGFVPPAPLGVHQSVPSEMSIAPSRADSRGYGELLPGLFQLVLIISVGCI